MESCVKIFYDLSFLLSFLEKNVRFTGMYRNKGQLRKHHPPSDPLESIKEELSD
jgi:hypothetical protein